jgi:hypothetical protein
VALSRLHNLLMILVVGLYLVLNQGFMQLRMPPSVGSGIPIGELALLFSLVIINYYNLLPRLSATVLLAPFLIWWILGLGRPRPRVRLKARCSRSSSASVLCSLWRHSANHWQHVSW